MNHSTGELSYAEQWSRFAGLAADYCELVETDSVRELAGLRFVRSSLVKLYGAATNLPEVVGGIETPDRVGHEEWKTVYRSLQERFGGYDLYWDSFNPLIRAADDPIANSLADDLADIWRDLKRSLDLIQSASSEQILGLRWQWRFDFESHWGAHAIGALRALHYILLQDI